MGQRTLHHLDSGMSGPEMKDVAVKAFQLLQDVMRNEHDSRFDGQLSQVDIDARFMLVEFILLEDAARTMGPARMKIDLTDGYSAGNAGLVEAFYDEVFMPWIQSLQGTVLEMVYLWGAYVKQRYGSGLGVQKEHPVNPALTTLKNLVNNLSPPSIGQRAAKPNPPMPPWFGTTNGAEDPDPFPNANGDGESGGGGGGGLPPDPNDGNGDGSAQQDPNPTNTGTPNQQQQAQSQQPQSQPLPPAPLPPNTPVVAPPSPPIPIPQPITGTNIQPPQNVYIGGFKPLPSAPPGRGPLPAFVDDGGPPDPWIDSGPSKHKTGGGGGGGPSGGNGIHHDPTPGDGDNAPIGGSPIDDQGARFGTGDDDSNRERYADDSTSTSSSNADTGISGGSRGDDPGPQKSGDTTTNRNLGGTGWDNSTPGAPQTGTGTPDPDSSDGGGEGPRFSKGMRFTPHGGNAGGVPYFPDPDVGVQAYAALQGYLPGVGGSGDDWGGTNPHYNPDPDSSGSGPNVNVNARPGPNPDQGDDTDANIPRDMWVPTGANADDFWSGNNPHYMPYGSQWTPYANVGVSQKSQIAMREAMLASVTIRKVGM